MLLMKAATLIRVDLKTPSDPIWIDLVFFNVSHLTKHYRIEIGLLNFHLMPICVRQVEKSFSKLKFQ